MSDTVKEYLLELLEYLDGRGLVLTDGDLIDQALDECGAFHKLKQVCRDTELPVASEKEIRMMPDKADFIKCMQQARDMLPVTEMMRSLNERSAMYLEFLAAAYLQETGLPASHVELVALTNPNHDYDGHMEVKRVFRRKE